MEVMSVPFHGAGPTGMPARSVSIDLPMRAGSSGGHKRSKQGVMEAFLARLHERGDVELTQQLVEECALHFDRLPTRYALDVNIDSLDVLSHKRLLEEARSDPATVSFAVRPVEVLHRDADSPPSPAFPEPSPQRGGHPVPPSARHRPLPKPAFGSSPNLQALALEVGELRQDASLASMDGAGGMGGEGPLPDSTFYEITIATVDQPKLLSRLSDAMGDLGLNIREAHVFNTTDSFALDVFVVDGWGGELGESLEEQLGQRLLRMPPPFVPDRQRSGHAGPGPGSAAAAAAAAPAGPGGWAGSLPSEPPPAGFAGGGGGPGLAPAAWNVSAPGGPGGSPAPDDWEIDINQLHIDSKVAAGSFSNLYKGFYCGQEVAVKILKELGDDAAQYSEFLQEVAIMRKVRHKNVVQFIGACTRKPNLCIVFEYMSHGSVYDWVRREGPLKLAQVLKVGVEVSRGMDYLHQRKIIHRDLKAANLLLDDNGTVKIADFGVARIIESSGHMTAETGTYRWMAPEVIEHKPYDEKADVFSFGVVLWELLTSKVPYSDMTPLQAAVGVVQKGLRPSPPQNCPPALLQLMAACWEGAPGRRPTFTDLTPRLQQLLEAAKEEEARRGPGGGGGAKQGLLSKLNLRGGGGRGG
ncbi:MAG: kinase-like domain-containing protein [Monoraphidium minutum]|nr:MAG: kinase-like domain-containing protein [Monoraphidium minutum]